MRHFLLRGTLASVVLLTLLFCGSQCFAWWSFNGYLYENAYGYFDPGSVYFNIRSVKNATYDEIGRLLTFDAYDEHGNYIFSEELYYIGNDVYNAKGERIALILTSGEPIIFTAGKYSDQPSAVITGPEIARILARTTSRFISSRVSNIMTQPAPPSNQVSQLRYPLDKTQLADKERASGLAAGEQGPRWGVWANGSVAKLGNSSQDTRFDGALYTGMTGADYRISDRLLVGFSVGAEHSNLRTQFNDGHQYLSGVTLAPYIGFALLDELILDVSASLTLQQGNQHRTMGFLRYDSRYQGTRTMLSSNLTYAKVLDNWRLSATGGFMYANDHAPEYTEYSQILSRTIDRRESYVGEFSLGGRVGYLFEKCEPYAGLTYLYDPWMTRGAELDRDEVEGLIGVNYVPIPAFLLSLELTNSFLRQDTNVTKLAINARYEF
jgi:hypothetical protein